MGKDLPSRSRTTPCGNACYCRTAATSAFRVDAPGVKTPVFGLAVTARTHWGPMPSPPDAAQKIREKLAAGTLPHHDAGGITFAGYGTGQLCDGCDTPILPAEMEYEVETRERRSIRFHVRCVLLWQVYARQRGGSDPAR